MSYTPERAREIQKLVDEVGLEGATTALGLATKTIKEALLTASRSINEDTAPILIIPDLHAPYHHKDCIEFFLHVQKKRGCRKRVVSVGDMVDFHSMSRHITETDADSPEEEYVKAMKFTAEFCEAFPEGDMVLGNHDMIPQRQMKDIGLATSILKSNNDLYGMSSGWKIHPLYHVIDPDGWNVLVEHGIGSAGKYGCANTAKEKRCSYIQGHTHSAAAVIYSQNHDSSIFGMNVGCCVDSSSLAMRYGKYGTRKGVMGCGVCTDEGWISPEPP